MLKRIDEDFFEALLPHLPSPEAAGSAYAEMDPTRPYRRPLAPQRSRPVASTERVTPEEPAALVRRRAAELVEQGRFTQAARLLDELLERGGAPEGAGELHLDLASALLLGGDYRRALVVYQRLVDDLRAPAADQDLITHCQLQAAICRVEIGELTTALDEFKSLFSDQRRRLGDVDPAVLELRRQIGLLMASLGNVGGALEWLEYPRGDLERLLGRDAQEVHDLRMIVERLRLLTD